MNNLLIILSTLIYTNAAPWTPENSPWNLNQNRTATQVSDYAVSWPNHTYFPSPENWRMPFYTIMPDRFSDGDPINNQVEGSPYEWDPNQVNFHFGGDMQGMTNRLDYLYDLGVRGLYVAGTPLKNLPWDSHFYNPIDFTLIDAHLGTLEDWRAFVAAAHAKGMYVVIDLTVSTAGDLLAFEGFLNKSTPLNLQKEYVVEYKSKIQYLDFVVNNTWDPSCDPNILPLYDLEGVIVNYTLAKGCYSGDFDQYGDLEAFGDYPAWQRQFAKFAGVQDRFRDWKPSVQDKLTKLVCLTIEGLDIDGIRVDKATQISIPYVVNGLGPKVRECARAVNKNNFFLPGEITAGSTLGTIFLGRGMLPNNTAKSVTDAFDSNGQKLDTMRKGTDFGLDSQAFSYSLYRGILDFMGLRGNLLAPGDVGADPVESYNYFLRQIDYTNAYTGKFDPRDLWGVGNQDTFRWPSIVDGIARFRLGQLITTLLLPGMPTLLYGDEQAFIMHDSRAENYIYGRQPMTTSEAWQLHGCYTGKASYQFIDMPFTNESRNACKDDSQSLDHFDYTKPSFLFTQNIYHIYRTYPIFTSGFKLETKLKQLLKFEASVKSVGQNIWSVVRDYLPYQNSTAVSGAKNVWFIYTNSNTTVAIENSCSSSNPIIGPSNSGQAFKNLFPPYNTISAIINSKNEACLDSISLPAYGFHAYVSTASFQEPKVTVVSVSPSHDARILREKNQNSIDLPITIKFSKEIPCGSIISALSLVSSSVAKPFFDTQSVACRSISSNTTQYGIPSEVYQWSATLKNVTDGIFELKIDGSISSLNLASSLVRMFRIGLKENVLVFTKGNAYSNTLLTPTSDSSILQLNNSAVGADMMRYSTDYHTTWSKWIAYSSLTNISIKEFNGIRSNGKYVVTAQYWCKRCGSAAYLVTSELDRYTRKPVSAENHIFLPSLYLFGEFNGFGNDQGVATQMTLKGKNIWEFAVIWKFPTNVSVDIWGDKTFNFGDVNSDGVLDRLPPNAQDSNSIYLKTPPFGYTSWKIIVDGTNYTYKLEPSGSVFYATVYYFLIAIFPIISGIALVYLFMRIFYKIVWNQKGRIDQDIVYRKEQEKLLKHPKTDLKLENSSAPLPSILIATLEYEIPDWDIKIRIGGLGVIASLMGTYLKNSIVWVVPMVKDVTYPECLALQPIIVTIYGKLYTIDVYCHRYMNVKYILLDAGIFRQRSKKEPYTPKMDDLTSAVFYSAWNQCIAEIITREKVDIYHINDFHCAIAPLYLLPKVIPCALSLHNAEFQGLWPLRTQVELDNVCSVFNIPVHICQKYIQYGNTFNLLHGAAMYLHYHQKGYGAGGVSDKYGERCFKRYPTLWALSEMTSIQNPNPADLEMDDQVLDGVVVDEADEANRIKNKLKTQAWAGFEKNAEKTLFIFVGRWSRQKGLDLIADLAPKIIETYPNAQIIAVGPVIDLHGRFAALKLQKLMSKYPDRMFIKPEFTKIPSFVFKGCDFVLLPSRDEPFGLVAVEFGRHGVLGIGSFVGGLGTMPGWWFPIESAEPLHLLNQFWESIQMAMKSTVEERRQMWHTAVKQRFPVAEWRKKLGVVYAKILQIHGAVDYETITENEQNMNDAFIKKQAGSRFVRSGLFDVDVESSRSSISSVLSRLSLSSSSTNRNSSRSSLGMFRTSSVDLERGKGFEWRRDNLSSLNPNKNKNVMFSLGSEVDFKSKGQSLDLNRSSQETFNNSKKNINESDIRLYFPQSETSASSLELSRDSNDSNSSVTVTAEPYSFELGQSAVKGMNDIVEYQPYQQFDDDEGKLEVQFKFMLQMHDSLYVGTKSDKEVCIDTFIKEGAEEYYNETTEERLLQTLEETHDRFIYFCKAALQYRIRKWPVYAILLAIGQLLAATIFQLVLLTGQWTSSDMQFNAISVVFIIGTMVWWTVYRRFSSVYVLSLPMYFFALALFLAGLPVGGVNSGYVKQAAVWSYTFASGSGALYFCLNFGEEAGVDMTAWIFRAGIFEGIRQLWTMGLWYWSHTFPLDNTQALYRTPSPTSTAISFILSILLVLIGQMLYYGLPDCYRNLPVVIPKFYSSFKVRGLAIWFVIAQFIQAYWLSGPYGRNWTFLWESPIKEWEITLLIMLFVLIWIMILRVFWNQSQIHSWILPVFAVGLLSPRWAQISWSTSNLGYSLNWPGSVGPYFSLMLWLWLAVLDSIQAVGLSMMLLQTLTRIHVAGTLMFAQILGACAFILARYTAPNSRGPGDVFPDPSSTTTFIANNSIFWIGLIFMVFISLGYLFWFRREQLSKP